MCQTGDERLGAPCPEGRAHVEAFSAQASAALAGHVGFYGGSINEDDLLGLSGNGRQPPAEPGMSGTPLAPAGRGDFILLFAKARNGAKSQSVVDRW